MFSLFGMATHMYTHLHRLWELGGKQNNTL
jgi:hypothetical protein